MAARVERRYPARRHWATVPEVAEYLGVSTRTIFAMLADDRLTGYRNGTRFIRLDLNEVDAAFRPYNGGGRR